MLADFKADLLVPQVCFDPKSLITKEFRSAVDRLGLPVIGVPIVNYDNSQHSHNENLRVGHFWRGIDTYAALLAALMAGFGSVISEVGASMMVGGNIRHQTRVLTTAIVLETSKGDLPLAIGLGIVLIFIVVAINALAWGARRAGEHYAG